MLEAVFAGPAPFSVVVDLGALRLINRVGAIVNITGSTTAVNDYLAIYYSAAAVAPDMTTGTWTSWGQYGSVDNVADIVETRVLFSRPNPIVVRFLKLTFGGVASCSSGCGPYRVGSILAQNVDATFSRLFYNGVQMSPNQIGVNMVRSHATQESRGRRCRFDCFSPGEAIGFDLQRC